MRLYCDNINDFTDKTLNSWSVDKGHEYQKGKVITLYNDYEECDFKIKWIHYLSNHDTLMLDKIEGSEYEREVISNHYAGYNLND